MENGRNHAVAFLSHGTQAFHNHDTLGKSVAIRAEQQYKTE